MITKEADSGTQESDALFAINLLLRLFTQPFFILNYQTMNLKQIIEELKKIDNGSVKINTKCKTYSIPDLDKARNMKLCYVEDGSAYFTDKPLDEVWGDDWDDIPYEHNAGTPYGDTIELKFSNVNLFEPCYGHLNSPYSVKAINSGAVAWLSNRDDISIMAGDTVSEFIEKVLSAGDSVFIPIYEIPNKKK